MIEKKNYGATRILVVVHVGAHLPVVLGAVGALFLENKIVL